MNDLTILTAFLMFLMPLAFVAIIIAKVVQAGARGGRWRSRSRLGGLPSTWLFGAPPSSNDDATTSLLVHPPHAHHQAGAPGHTHDASPHHHHDAGAAIHHDAGHHTGGMDMGSHTGGCDAGGGHSGGHHG